MEKNTQTNLEKIAYDCKKATFLIEKKQGGQLTGRDKLELKIHLAGCYICRIYEQQSLLISQMMRNFIQNEAATEIKLSDDFKKALATQIANKIAG